MFGILLNKVVEQRRGRVASRDHLMTSSWGLIDRSSVLLHRGWVLFTMTTAM